MTFLKLLTYGLLIIVVNADTIIAGWKQHITVTHKFPCNRPQPRSIPFRELLSNINEDDFGTYEISAIPSETILHRCESSGVCTGINTICAPLKTENVKLVFLGFNRAINHSRKFIIEATNHTLCGCQKQLINPKGGSTQPTYGHRDNGEETIEEVCFIFKQ